MIIRIIENKSGAGEGNISHLVGKEFEVTTQDDAGIYIAYGPTGQYLIHGNEYEVVGEEEA